MKEIHTCRLCYSTTHPATYLRTLANETKLGIQCQNYWNLPYFWCCELGWHTWEC